MRFDREIKAIAAFVGILIVVFGAFVVWKMYEREQYRAEPENSEEY